MLLLVMGWSRTVEAQESDINLQEQVKQPFVNKIVFKGNKFFSEKQLKGQMSTKASTFFSVFRKPRFKMDVLQRDIAGIEALYHANGFLEAKVGVRDILELENGTFVDIFIDVTENEPVRVETVTFRNEGLLDKKRLNKGLLLEAGDPYNPSMVASDIATIKRKYFEKGYLGVVVQDSVSMEGRRVTLRYAITPGPVIAIGSIEIVGNQLTKTSIIEKEITLKVGEVFELGEAIETQRNLFETGLFTEADVIPARLDMTTRTVGIVVRVRERKSAYVEAGFGVGNVVGSRVVGEWGDRNLFGTGRTLRLKVEYAFAIFPREDEFSDLDPRVRFYLYEGTFAQRRVFGTKVLLGLTGFVEKDATVENLVVNSRGASIGGRRRFGSNTDLVLGFTLERIRRRSLEGTDKSSSHSIANTLSHDTRDFILDPRTGGFRSVDLAVAGGVLGGDDDFYSASATAQRYWGLRPSFTLAARARVGFADPYGQSPEVPVENRFFTGGGNSVRGYEESSVAPKDSVLNASTGLVEETVIGGRVLLLTNIELRFPLPLLSRFRFSGAVFADGGNVWPDLESLQLKNFRPFKDRDQVGQTDYRFSLGLGIRYNTPLGPIRLDYGLPLTVQDGQDRSGRFHFSLGQIF
ncbi:MAG: outer membrane protein assembly factor BamA [Candidatus Krumholzibacteria bacterium]|nr:outer membrane protein assembly factor BamA [Candidatus Krumholzibacteria bacterium]